MENCIIIIISYLNDHKIIADYKKSIEVNVLSKDQKQEALKVLQSEYVIALSFTMIQITNKEKEEN